MDRMLFIGPVPSRRRTPARVAAALVLCAGLLTGCSGSVDPAVSESSSEPLPEASSVVVAPGAVVPESDGGGVAMPSDAPADDSPTLSENVADDCATLQAAWNATNQALVNLSPDHPRTLVNSFRIAGESMAGVDAIEAIADDWATMSEYFNRVNAAFEGVDANDADAVTGAFNATVSAEDTQNTSDAHAGITAFLSADCQTG